MAPTIGRIVLYRDGNGADFPAIVTAVHSDRVVSLVRFAGNQQPAMAYTSVDLYVEGEIQPQSWRWPERVG